MRSPPSAGAANPAVRRFATIWSLSLALKIAALAVLLFLLLKLFGGF